MGFSMKTISSAAAALAVGLSSAGAWAQAVDDQDAGLTADVGETCLVTYSSQSATTNFGSFSGGALEITPPASAEPLWVDAQTTLTFDGMCNYGAQISIESSSGGIKSDWTGPIDGDFVTEVFYQASAFWSAGGPPIVFTSMTTNGTPETSASSVAANPINGEFSVIIDLEEPANSSAPMLSGTYSDTLTVQIGAAL